MTVQVGAGELSSSLLFYCLLWEDMSLFNAYKIVYAFWVYHQIRITIEAEYVDPTPHWVSVAIFAFMVYAMTLQEDTAKIVLQVASA